MKRKIHYAWVILICAVLIQGGIIGLLVNPAGVLLTAVRGERGFRAGDLSVYYTIRQLVMAASVGVTSRLFFSRSPRMVMGLLGLCGASSFVFMAGFDYLWQWYGAAVMAGIGISCCTVVIPVVLNNWFQSKRGLVVGISMSASGVVGACYSPICSWLVETTGWRSAAAVTGVLSFGMTLAGCLFMSASPQNMGMEPYGAAKEKIQSSAPLNRETGPVPKWVYAAALAAVIVPNTYTQFNNQIPVFLQAVGYSLGTGAVLTSISMTGNIMGKLVVGILSDRLGIFRAIRVLLIFFGVSQVFFFVGADVLPVLQIGAFLYGTVYAMGTTVPSQLFLALYGEQRYRSKVQSAQTVNFFAMAFAGILFPYIYDFTGSFMPVFALGAAVCVTALGFMVCLERACKGLS